jgi:hypothetical protein
MRQEPVVAGDSTRWCWQRDVIMEALPTIGSRNHNTDRIERSHRSRGSQGSPSRLGWKAEPILAPEEGSSDKSRCQSLQTATVDAKTKLWITNRTGSAAYVDLAEVVGGSLRLAVFSDLTMLGISWCC